MHGPRPTTVTLCEIRESISTIVLTDECVQGLPSDDTVADVGTGQLGIQANLRVRRSYASDPGASIYDTYLNPPRGRDGLQLHAREH